MEVSTANHNYYNQQTNNPNMSIPGGALHDFSSEWNSVICNVGLYAARTNSTTSNTNTAAAAASSTMDMENANDFILEITLSYLDTLRTYFEIQGDEMLDDPPSQPPPPPSLALQSMLNHSGTRNAFDGSKNDNLDGNGGISARRILIRLLTTASEINALKALRLGKAHQWVNGADAYSMSYEQINRALNIADGQYVKLVQLEQLQQHHHHHHHDPNHAATLEQIQTQKNYLVHDSNIVHVAISHFATDRDMYTNIANKRLKYLRTKLQPQWSTRDEVRNRIGSDRWRNNPNPKNDYAQLRERDEKELGDLVHSIQKLDCLDVDVVELKVKDIMNYTKYGSNGGDKTVTTKNDVENNSRSSVRPVRRYNGIRPNYDNPLSPQRIPYELYPDPTTYGWIFTGSHEPSYVEFYEKIPMNDGIVVKLDLYYTTGTIKTSMDHPRKGHTQLFASNSSGSSNSNGRSSSEENSGMVSPELYMEILENPRVHTNVRYQRKQNGGDNKNNNGNKNRNNRSRDRGGGRGGRRGGRRRYNGRGGRGGHN